MIGATWFYVRCRWRNRLRRWLAKLRQPRYALGLLLGCGYMLFVLGLPLLGSFLGHAVGRPTGPSPVFQWILVGLLAYSILSQLLTAGGEPGLPFAKAELFFLAGAPVSRRELLGFWFLVRQPAFVRVLPVSVHDASQPVP